MIFRLQQRQVLARGIQLLAILLLTACAANQFRVMVQPKPVITDELSVVPSLDEISSAADSLPESTEGVLQATPKPKPKRYVVYGDTYEVMEESLGYVEVGIASWYGKKFHGRLTANGEVYDMYELTAAHKALPLPSLVRVTNLENGAKVIVRVNDRGPFHDDRLIDLSYQAAVKLGFSNKGTVPVVVEALDELNYPDRVASDKPDKAITRLYLQIGVFERVGGASRLRDRVASLLEREGLDVTVQVLQSENDQIALNKVWIGPIQSAADESGINSILVELQLGQPIRVETH